MDDEPSLILTLEHLRNNLIKNDPQRQKAFAAAQQQLAGSGVSEAQAQTVYQKTMIQRFNAQILAEVYYPGILGVSVTSNYVDGDISAPKAWRDVYHHDQAGRITGWTRNEAGKTSEFNWEGLAIYQQDRLGRCVTGRAVSYVRDGQANPRQRPEGCV